ncbi:hypothetical protein [Mesobacillus zeae]|nr:hypothetical protein [Mesobacillus zeae]
MEDGLVIENVGQARQASYCFLVMEFIHVNKLKPAIKPALIVLLYM